jgi:outer membrane protein, heavy metal efflux system
MKVPLSVSVLVSSMLVIGCAQHSVSKPLSPASIIRLTEDGLHLESRRLQVSAKLSGYTLPELVRFALDHSPEIKAARAQYTAAAEQITQATALPDPRVSFRYFVEEVETRVGPQEYAVGLTQSLPWIGKLKHQGEVAQLGAQAARARIGVVQNALIADVAAAWYELYYLGRAATIVRSNRELMVHLERVARTRYGTASAAHADVIRAQVELGKIENELASLEDRKIPLLARLNAALNRPSNAYIEIPEAAFVDAINLDDQELLNKVVGGNPELQVKQLEITMAKASRDRAQQSFYPDFAVGIDYIATGDARLPNQAASGKDPLSASLSFTLPVAQGKYRAGVRAAQAGIDAEYAQRDRLLNRLESSAVTALFRLRDAKRQVELYGTTLLPKARESLIATQRAYSSGASGFADLMDAERMLLVFELAEARATTDFNLARIELEELTGESLIRETAKIRDTRVSPEPREIGE